MANRFDYTACEPFRAWNRLEPRTRKEDFTQALRTEVHDPLWFLARQWQFGEFKGEDTGSAILAKIQIEKTNITKYKPRSSSSSLLINPHSEPLEKMVESVPILLGYKSRVRAGQYFLKLLKKLVSAASIGIEAYELHVQTIFKLQKPELLDTDSEEIMLQKKKLMADRKLMQFLHLFCGRVPDGLLLYDDAKKDVNQFLNDIVLDQSHRNTMLLVISDYMNWFEACFHLNITENTKAWNPKQLEYQFACSLPEKNKDATVLTADEYYSGHLDWYSFDIDLQDHSSDGLAKSTAEEQLEHVTKETFSFIPTEASYAGMPNNRWWEFEDGKVDLGNISASTTDIAKIVVAEYALIYGNDWFIIPYSVPVGSLSKINGLMVTDVFGEKTLVEAASQGESDDWSSWGYFNLSFRENTLNPNRPCDTRLLIPPSVMKNHESNAIEEVLFVRDEMANMVWGIETYINDLMGQGADAHTIANELKLLLHGPDAPPLDAHELAVLKYTLSTTVPENWIPFIPIHVGNQNRKIQLQRASMPREMESGFIPIRPRTTLLREGFVPNPVDELAPYINSRADEQQQPYFINEEEIPRSGIIVHSNLQRTRWYNGKTLSWYGYKKKLGKGEGNSGLRFDQMELLKKNKPELEEENA